MSAAFESLLAAYRGHLVALERWSDLFAERGDPRSWAADDGYSTSQLAQLDAMFREWTADPIAFLSPPAPVEQMDVAEDYHRSIACRRELAAQFDEDGDPTQWDCFETLPTDTQANVTLLYASWLADPAAFLVPPAPLAGPTPDRMLH